MNMIATNRTESTLITSLQPEQRNWCSCDDGRREFRIGTVVNCNDELPKNSAARIDTCANIAQFLERLGITSYEIYTISNSYEYSSCLRIADSEYMNLKKIVSSFVTSS